MASQYLFNPSKEQMFQLLAENLLRGIVGASQEGNGKFCHFVYISTDSKYCRDSIDIVV